MKKYDILNSFEEIVEEIGKDENLDLRVDTNYSKTTSSMYPTIGFYNLLDEDEDDLYIEITCRLSDHETGEIPKDLVFYFNEFEDLAKVKDEIKEEVLSKLEGLTFTRDF